MPIPSQSSFPRKVVIGSMLASLLLMIIIIVLSIKTMKYILHKEADGRRYERTQCSLGSYHWHSAIATPKDEVQSRGLKFK